MPILKHYLPTYVDVDRAPNATISTRDELDAVEFVSRAMVCPGFKRLSACKSIGFYYLMAEYGKEYFVIGTLDSIDGLDLNEFAP
jgi:hypothetical protein